MDEQFINPNEHQVANRIQDESINSELEYYENPKEYFRLVLDEIEAELGATSSLLDVGCANGAFLHHARRRFQTAELQGMEPISSLATIARKRLPDVVLHNCGLFDPPPSSVKPSRAVTMLGVLYVLREPEEALSRLLRLVCSGGAAFIFGAFNEEPIDVLMTYRRAPDGEWISAHHLFSMVTIEHLCEKLGVSCRWVDFSLSRSIPKTDDPMRSWTEPFRGNPNFIVYGTNMFTTMKLLVIRKRDA